MHKKIIPLLLVMCFLLVSCQRATDDTYSIYTEKMWIEDPDYVSSDTDDLTNTDSGMDNSTNGKSSGNSSDASKSDSKPRILNVKDFGATGDGITDDGYAIIQACLELQNCAAGSQLIFESNKTYFVSDLKGLTDAALFLEGLNDVAVKGSNTTILLDRDKRYMYMQDSKNVTVQGFNFDLKERAHYVGTVESVNKEEHSFEVVSDRDFGFSGEFTPARMFYGLKAGSGTTRSYIFVAKLSTIDKKSLRYRIYGDISANSIGTAANIENLNVGDKVILPTPNIGHYGDNMINIHGNTNIAFKDINVWNSREFVWVIRSNKEKITFDNVNVVPAPDENVCFSSWRDCFHCKDNSASLIWTNCTVKGNGDDMFNLSSSMMYVNKVFAANEVECYWPEQKGGSYGSVEPGTPIVIWDGDTGKLIGKTRLKKVVNEKNNRYQFTDNLPKLKSGSNIRFCFDSLSSQASKIVNCNLDGTLRFRRGPVTIENCNIRMITLWIEWEGNIEGPIPHDIAFNNCKFNVVGGSEAFRINAFNPIVKWKEGLYRLENISFNNCTGLKKANFQNQLVFKEGSTDYVKFTPAVTE